MLKVCEFFRNTLRKEAQAQIGHHKLIKTLSRIKTRVLMLPVSHHLLRRESKVDEHHRDASQLRCPVLLLVEEREHRTGNVLLDATEELQNVKR